MTYTYTWTDAEQTSLKREDENGNVAFVPTDPGNRDYAEFLASGETAAPYVAPPTPKALTTEEKVNHLLSDYDLTRSELLTALQDKPAVAAATDKVAISSEALTSGAEQFKGMDTQTMLDFARANGIKVDERMLGDDELLRQYLAASMNTQALNS
jgi:hypothetical protein